MVSGRKAALLAALNASCPESAREFASLSHKLQPVRVVDHMPSPPSIEVVRVALTALPADGGLGGFQNMRVAALSALAETSAPLEFHIQTSTEWTSLVKQNIFWEKSKQK